MKRYIVCTSGLNDSYPLISQFAEDVFDQESLRKYLQSDPEIVAYHSLGILEILEIDLLANKIEQFDAGVL